MGNQHKHEILSVAVKVAAFDESGIRRDFFNSLLLPNQPRLAPSPLAVHSYWAKWHRKPPEFTLKDIPSGHVPVERQDQTERHG